MDATVSPERQAEHASAGETRARSLLQLTQFPALLGGAALGAGSQEQQKAQVLAGTAQKLQQHSGHQSSHGPVSMSAGMGKQMS